MSVIPSYHQTIYVSVVETDGRSGYNKRNEGEYFVRAECESSRTDKAMLSCRWDGRAQRIQQEGRPSVNNLNAYLCHAYPT